MSYFYCPVCHVFIDSEPCSYCVTRAILSTGNGDYIHSSQPGIAISRDTVEAIAPRNRLASNDIQTPQKDTSTVKNLEYGITAKENFNHVGSISSVPGPSGFRENKNISNFSTEKMQDSNISESEPLARQYTKTFTCWVCKKKIDEHPNKEGERNPYVCCVCKFNTSIMYKLQMHSRIHCGKTICTICSKYYTEGDSHEGERKCIVCEKTFKCKSLLYQHYVHHKEYFDCRCWDCTTSIGKHFITTGKKNLFFCCICKFETYSCLTLMMHNQNHRRIVCEICNEKYIEEEDDFHSKEFKCTVCEEMFKCKNVLEDHYENHESHLKTYCILCNKNMKDNHGIRMNKRASYNCCKCLQPIPFDASRLQTHLYSHTDLKLFKCDACGMRLKSETSLKGHLKNACVSLPKKCEISQARFHDNLSLVFHSVKKHGYA